MRFNKHNMMLGMAVAAGLFFNVAAHADPANQETIFTFNKPIQVAGKVLPAGTYRFELADHGVDSNYVEIFNPQGTKLYTTAMTNPTDRLQVTGDTRVTLAKVGSGEPDAMLTWYYPGDEIGHQFIYSHHEEKQLAQDHVETVMANTHNQ